MKPIDIRNENWESIYGRLSKERLDAWIKLGSVGPCTTRKLAEAMGLRVEDVRPRVTELYQMGFVVLSSKVGKEGVYKAVSIPQAKSTFEERKAAGDQMLLL